MAKLASREPQLLAKGFHRFFDWQTEEGIAQDF